jgi:SAM-dependent methyltransferase
MADQGSEGLLSPFLRDRRLEAARPHLRGRVLDLGCGGGRLAQWVQPGDYLGFDVDPASLAAATGAFPQHRFATQLPAGERFDTLVALAVIEHLPEPERHLAQWRELLAPGGSMVLTTPHPHVDRLHRLGARLGIFSRHASEEHQDLLDRAGLVRVADLAGLRVEHYRRFLLGANQLVVLRAD